MFIIEIQGLNIEIVVSKTVDTYSNCLFLISSKNKRQFPVSEPYSHAYFIFKYMKKLISPR